MFYFSLAFSAGLVTAALLGIIMLFSGGYLPPNFYSYSIFVLLLLIFYRHETNNSGGQGI